MGFNIHFYLFTFFFYTYFKNNIASETWHILVKKALKAKNTHVVSGAYKGLTEEYSLH